jgi:predicted nucleic acid-binding protein
VLILPDTSCWIEFFRPRGDKAVRSHLLNWLGADCLAICGPVRAEILRGARKAEAPQIMEAFAALRHLESVEDDWLTVEQKARTLADDGHNVPLLDLLIAAIAHRRGTVLAHKDAHFHTIAQVLPVRLHNFLEP